MHVLPVQVGTPAIIVPRAQQAVALIFSGARLPERLTLGSAGDSTSIAEESLTIEVAGVAVCASALASAAMVARAPGDGSAVLQPVEVVPPLLIALARLPQANEGVIVLAKRVACGAGAIPALLEIEEGCDKEDDETKVEFI